MAGRLTDDQYLSLVSSAWNWTLSLRALRQDRDASRDRVKPSEPGLIYADPVDLARYRAGVHMAVLSLDHIKKCLERSKARWSSDDAFPRQEAAAYLDAWSALGQLRHVLEHEDKYIAGVAHDQRKRVDEAARGDFRIRLRGRMVPMFGNRELRTPEGLLSGYWLFGVEYDLRQAFDGAERLVPLLQAYLFHETP